MAETATSPLAEQRAYRVQPGDTLWAIARGQLGSGASSAELAREVERLWKLNAARLRSGNPDLIKPGELILL